MFEPALASGPSGLGDPPRPFVFRAHHLDGRLLESGEQFHVDVHIFDTTDPALAFFTLAFAQLATEGLGPRRGRVKLLAVHSLTLRAEPDVELYTAGAFRLATPPAPLSLSLLPRPGEIQCLTVYFETPTELKGVADVYRHLPFATLFARVRDRISTLRALYGVGPLEIDFKGMAERAALVRLVELDLKATEVSRRSSRTGQVHGIGGFVGMAAYAGNLTEFAPYFEAGGWTGVGRHAVFGSGVLRCEGV